MKKILLSFVICLLSFGSAFAAPRFKGVDNKHRKTTIRIEIPASDRDSSNGLSVDNVRLSNNGETLAARKVDAIWAMTRKSFLSSRRSPLLPTACFHLR